MYALTGASGQLGRLTIENLLKSIAPDQIVAAVRDPAAADNLAARGIQVRLADYDRRETLAPAFAGVSKLLLISSNLTTGRIRQHQAVMDAAATAGVGHIFYTGMLHADRRGAKLAIEHRETEMALEASGLATTILRNGWYTENYLMALRPALAGGALYGAAGDGQISLAARADYAAAAAAALVAANPDPVYELAGDKAWTLSDLAAEISRQAGQPLAYANLPQDAYEAALVSAGLPSELADLLADADAQAAQGVLFDDSHALSRLIGRSTTPVAESVAAALKSMQ
jgi:NAD(P)H dehydrogenase (quinone)